MLFFFVIWFGFGLGVVLLFPFFLLFFFFFLRGLVYVPANALVQVQVQVQVQLHAHSGNIIFHMHITRGDTGPQQRKGDDLRPPTAPNDQAAKASHQRPVAPAAPQSPRSSPQSPLGGGADVDGESWEAQLWRQGEEGLPAVLCPHRHSHRSLCVGCEDPCAERLLLSVVGGVGGCELGEVSLVELMDGSGWALKTAG